MRSRRTTLLAIGLALSTILVVSVYWANRGGALASNVAALTVVSDVPGTTLEVGRRAFFEAYAVDETGLPLQPGSYAVAWASSDSAIFAVEPSGLVFPLKSGRATITATSGNTTASVDLRVVSYQGALLTRPDSAYIAQFEAMDPDLLPDSILELLNNYRAAMEADSDDDGVIDLEDRCPRTPPTILADETGCGGTVDEVVANLPTATYAFNPPASMRVGDTYRIVLRLEPDPVRSTESVDDTTAMRARLAVVDAVSAVRPEQAVDSVTVARRVFADRMEATLTGPESWSIQPQGGMGPRGVSRQDSTVWSWDVTPSCRRATRVSMSLSCERETLSLTVSAWLDVSGRDTPVRWMPLDRTIGVRVTVTQMIAGFVGDNWQWLWTTLLVPGAAVDLKRRSGSASTEREQVTVRILFLGANPTNTDRLRLDEEVRAIDRAIRASDFRDRFQLIQHWAVRETELDDLLLRERPHVVHFSGHGSSDGELVFEEDDTARGRVERGKRRAPRDAVGALFAVLGQDVRCVVLNACYTAKQADAIAEHVDFVVGMSEAVGDAAAIRFAGSFYQALAYGRDIKTAFDLGCAEVDLARLPDSDVPRLIALRSDPSQATLIDTSAPAAAAP